MATAPAFTKRVDSLDETLKKKKALKQDPQLEQDLRAWIAQVLPDGGVLESEPLGPQLKSGVVLCRLLNTIQPGCVARIHESALAFKQMENIEKFLHVCRTHFGMTTHELFTTIDLFEEKDMHVVFLSLRVLAFKCCTIADYSGPLPRGMARSAARDSAPGDSADGGGDGAGAHASSGERAAPKKRPLKGGACKTLDPRKHVRRTERSASTISGVSSSSALASSTSSGGSSSLLAVPSPEAAARKQRKPSFNAPTEERSAYKPSVPAHLQPSTRRTLGRSASIVGMGAAASVSSLDMDIQTKKALQYDQKLEANAVEWIRRCVPADEAAKYPPSCDLHALAKDGVLLCLLLNEIKSGTVPSINRTKNPFKQRENIQAYLDGCRAVGLHSTGLFNTSDLYEAKNMQLVLANLVMLDMHVRKKIATWKGPPLASSARAASANIYAESLMMQHQSGDVKKRPAQPGLVDRLEPADQELIQWVNGLLAQHDEYDPTWNVSDISKDFCDGVRLLRMLEVLTSQSVGNINGECSILWNQIQNVLLALQILAQHTHTSGESGESGEFGKEHHRVQHIVRGEIPVTLALLRFMRASFDRDATLHTTSDDLEKRSALSSALLSIEQTFVSSLTTLKFDVVGPLQMDARSPSSSIVDRETVRMFDMLDTLLPNHSRIYNELSKLLSDFQLSTSLANVFECVATLELFVPVADVWEVEKLRRSNMMFHSVLDAFETTQLDKHGLDFNALLLLPEQLASRYLHVLMDFQKFTNYRSFADGEALARAVEHLGQIVVKAGRHTLKFDNMRKLMSIQHSIEPSQELLDAKRRFITEGFLSVVDESAAGSVSAETGSPYVFLLSDLLIVCLYTGDTFGKLFKHIRSYPTSAMEEVRVCPDVAHPSFLITVEGGGQLRATAPVAEDLERWASAVGTCISGQLLDDDEMLSDVSGSDDDDDEHDVDSSLTLSLSGAIRVTDDAEECTLSSDEEVPSPSEQAPAGGGGATGDGDDALQLSDGDDPYLSLSDDD